MVVLTLGFAWLYREGHEYIVNELARTLINAYDWTFRIIG
jgi:hypothetical protein